MEKIYQNIIPNTVEKEEAHLDGKEGIDLLSQQLKFEENYIQDFLVSEKGREFLKTKKIIIAGPPRSGKSCFREGIKNAIKKIPGAPYPYILTACPDGEGSWFQESMNNDPEAALKYKNEYKSKFTEGFVNRISDSVKKINLDLNFIDIGGVISGENKQICDGANSAVLICGESAVKSGIAKDWQNFFSSMNIPIIAVLYSDYLGKEDVVTASSVNEPFIGSIHHLERGENLSDRETISSLAQYILDLGKENKSMDIEKSKIKIDELISEWQTKLPEFKIVLGGSLVSGLFISDEKTEYIDVDVRFLYDGEFTEDIIRKIEEVTGLKFRKNIKVADWPEGMSDGVMIEGKLYLPGIDLPLDIEGCLRNTKYIGWAKYYQQVLSEVELKEFAQKKKELREDKEKYKKLKNEMLHVVINRCKEKGLV